MEFSKNDCSQNIFSANTSLKNRFFFKKNRTVSEVFFFQKKKAIRENKGETFPLQNNKNMSPGVCCQRVAAVLIIMKMIIYMLNGTNGRRYPIGFFNFLQTWIFFTSRCLKHRFVQKSNGEESIFQKSEFREKCESFPGL